MKLLAAIAVLSLFVSSLAGCAGKGSSGDPPTYRCPSCQEVVRWKMRADRFGIASNWKTVTHRCPSCNDQWVAGVSEGNACVLCAEQSLECPVCAARHSASGN